MCQQGLILLQEYNKVRGFIQLVEEFHGDQAATN